MYGNKDEQLVDIDIVEDMSNTEESAHYRRYITDRFEVAKIHDAEMGLCAHVRDNEMGDEFKLHTGDQLADGTVEVVEEGVVYKPPRADVERFMLPASQEMSPIGNHLASRKRHDMDGMLQQEHMMMPTSDEDDKLIIVLSSEPMTY
tara:strand:- start:3610 stop:4050 length:441 start_codon:yes stop_codon:yes gene_type:complete